MNELTIFNRDVIPVYTTDKGEQVVVGRELHEALSINRDYSNWFKQMCGYGFEERKDYSPFLAIGLMEKPVNLELSIFSNWTWQSTSP